MATAVATKKTSTTNDAKPEVETLAAVVEPTLTPEEQAEAERRRQAFEEQKAKILNNSHHGQVAKLLEHLVPSRHDAFDSELSAEIDEFERQVVAVVEGNQAGLDQLAKALADMGEGQIGTITEVVTATEANRVNRLAHAESLVNLCREAERLLAKAVDALKAYCADCAAKAETAREKARKAIEKAGLDAFAFHGSYNNPSQYGKTLEHWAGRSAISRDEIRASDQATVDFQTVVRKQHELEKRLAEALKFYQEAAMKAALN